MRHHIVLCVILYLEHRSHLELPHSSQDLSVIIVDFQGEELNLLMPSAPLLPHLKPPPPFLPILQMPLHSGALPQQTHSGLFLKISSFDFPPSQIYHHTFYSPKVINVCCHHYLSLTSCSLLVYKNFPRHKLPIIF